MSYPHQRHKFLKIFAILSICLIAVVLFNAFSMGFAAPVIPSDLTLVQYVNWRSNKCFYFLNNSQVYFLKGYKDEEKDVYYWNVTIYYEASFANNHLYLNDGVEIYDYSFVKDNLYTGNELYSYNGKVDLGLSL